ncbi:kinetochore protein spc7 [Ceratobasidium sp. AG-Ba]|nr:kinetochore protein spc7 [Ceratobasidium sp. AG-Ba]
MGYWNKPLVNEMEFEVPRPMDNIVYETTSAWDEHVMDIDYDVSQALFLVLDTNFLLKHLVLLRSLSDKLLEIGHLIPPMFFVLPGVVVDELDYQSKNGVRERATAATAWLQEQIEQRVRTGRGVLRAQKEDETVRGIKSWRSLRGRGENDNIILDCCLYFSQLSNGQVRLLSQDRNLALKATISGIYRSSRTNILHLVNPVMHQDIQVIQVSKDSSAEDFLKEVMPELQLDLLLPAQVRPTIADRSSFASRWAPAKSTYTPRVTVPPQSYHLTVPGMMHDDDIDMDDAMSISPASHHPSHSANDETVYRRLAEDPLENLIKNLQYNDVLTRAAGAISFPETPRQTLVRISKSIPPQILYFVSDREEPGYRAGGIKMWSRGDVASATAVLERLFSELDKWDDDQTQDPETMEDKIKARKALVSIIRGFKDDEKRWRDNW